MSCCSHCEIGDEQFGAKSARRDLKRYRKKGPDATTLAMIDVLGDHVAPGAKLIDVGSGIGALSQALLDGPVSHSTLVDESSSYLDTARELAQERGTVDRCNFVRDDFVHAQPALEAADIVTLDRVVCCYPDYENLLGSVGQTGASWCGFSHPRERWYVKPVVAFINFTRWLAQSEFRVFIHSEQGMKDVLEADGFDVCWEGGTFVWRVAVAKRTGPISPRRT